jgi:hypothetical protein
VKGRWRGRAGGSGLQERGTILLDGGV